MYVLILSGSKTQTVESEYKWIMGICIMGHFLKPFLFFCYRKHNCFVFYAFAWQRYSVLLQSSKAPLQWLWNHFPVTCYPLALCNAILRCLKQGHFGGENWCILEGTSPNSNGMILNICFKTVKQWTIKLITLLSSAFALTLTSGKGKPLLN